MDGAGLSDHEQRILSEIESDLQGDETLDRRMRTMRWGHPVPHLPTRMPKPSGLTVSLLGALSLTLLIAAVVTTAQALIWAFAVVWAVTVLGAFQLVCCWMKRTGDRGT
ncbi:hypothetical protein GCM10020367_62330 [Streptomyces sannanensis]|uniref:DUF3040 domain-containing protein n=1 Tax=Streptomyces sannanensis TaxID=285536 RepID=A0ABP6SLB5_9ACTN